MSVLNPAYSSKVVPCHAGSQTASSNGISIDTLGFHTLAFFYSFGTTTTGTSGTATFKLQESSDNSSFTDITSATTSALTLDTGGQNAKTVCIPLKLIGRKRYIRAVLTIAGTANTGATGPLNNAGALVAFSTDVTLSSSNYDTFVTMV